MCLFYAERKNNMNVVFDKFYSGYDDWYETSMGAFVDRVETKAAFSLLDPKAKMKILDAGCGTGNFSIKLVKAGCYVTGVDLSLKMLEQAEQKFPDDAVKLHKGDICGMGFKDNTFDAVISMAAFEFINNPAVAYRELKRVVKPGGRIVIGTIQNGGSWAEYYERNSNGSAYGEATFKSKDDLISLDPKGVTGIKECLFVPPGLAENNYNLDNEIIYSGKINIGGFVCVRFQKKN